MLFENQPKSDIEALKKTPHPLYRNGSLMSDLKERIANDTLADQEEEWDKYVANALDYSVKIWEERLKRTRRWKTSRRVVDRLIIALFVVFAFCTLSPQLLGEYRLAVLTNLSLACLVASAGGTLLLALDPSRRLETYALRLEHMITFARRYLNDLHVFPTHENAFHVATTVLQAYELLRPDEKNWLNP